MARGMMKKMAALLALTGAPTAMGLLKLERAFTAVVPAKFVVDAEVPTGAPKTGTFYQAVAGTPWATDFAAKPNAMYAMDMGAAEQSAFDPYTKLVFAAGEQGFLHVYGAPH
jgi:hypothetical protein